jgi:hypothetical protein
MLAVTALHAAPTRRSEQITETLLGEPLRVDAVEGGGDGWLRVVGADEYAGWLPASHVAAVGAGWPGRDGVRVGALGAEVSADDGTTLRRVVFGCRLASEGPRESGAPVRVRLPDGIVGHLDRDALPPFYGTTASEGARLEAMATSLLGIPYRWGGRSPHGFDCSGLVQLVAAEAGVRLPRDSDLMEAHLAARAERIDPTERARGDLVFWGPPERATHVGIALDGDRFLHAREWVRIGRGSGGRDADLAPLMRGVYRITPPPAW